MSTALHPPRIIITHSPYIREIVSSLAAVETIIFEDFSKENINISSHINQIWWIDGVSNITNERVKKFVKLLRTKNIMSYGLFNQPFFTNTGGNSNSEQQVEALHFLQQASPYTSLFLFRGAEESDVQSARDKKGGIRFSSILDKAFSLATSPRGGKRYILTPPHFVNLVEGELVFDFPEQLIARTGYSGGKPTLSEKKTDEDHFFVESLLPKPAFSQKQKTQIEIPHQEKTHKNTDSLHVFSRKIVPESRGVVIPTQLPPDIHRSKIVLSHIPDENQRKSTPWNTVGVSSVLKKISEPVETKKETKSFEKKFDNVFQQTLQPVEVDHEGLEKKLARLQKPNPLKQKVVTKMKKRRKFVGLLLFVWFLALGTVGAYVGTVWWMKKTFIEFTHQIQTVEQHSLKLRGFSVGVQFLKIAQPVAQVFQSENEDKNLAKLLEASTVLQEFFQIQTESSAVLTRATQQLLGTADGDVFTTVATFPGLAEASYKKLSTLETIVKNPEYEDLLFGKEREEVTAQLIKIRKVIRIQQEFTRIFPEVFAKEGKKVYAIILQDSQESRPSGGKLMTVALVTFEKGKLVNYQILPASSLDQLTEVATPPEEVKQYLQVENWSFNETNWDPDFPIAAKQIIWYLEKNLSQSVDGVITIPSPSFKQLIGPIGGIPLAETGEIVDEQNFLEKIRFYTFQKRTNPEKEFTSLLDGFFREIKQQEVAVFTTVLSEMYLELQNHEIAIFSKDSDTQDLVTTLGWSGGVITPNCPALLVQSLCHVSTFYESRTNVAKNKVSLDLSKKSAFTVTFSPNSINYKYAFSYKTISKDINWPGGVAQELVRIYLPPIIEVQQLQLGESIFSPEDIQQKIVGDRKVVEFVINVPPEGELQGELRYTEPSPEKPPFSYSFFLQKQPGVTPSATTIDYEYVSPFLPSLVAPQATISDNHVHFDFSGDDHIFTGMKFREILQTEEDL